MKNNHPKRRRLTLIPRNSLIVLGHTGRGSTYAVPSELPVNTYSNLVAGGRMHSLVNGQQETGRVSFCAEEANITPAFQQQLLARFPYLDLDNLSA